VADLDRRLEDLGQHIAFPPTPDLASPLRRRIMSDQGRTRWWRSGYTRLALGAAVLAVLGASALLRRNTLIYGLGGLIVPFIGIKIIDMLLAVLGLK